MHIATNFIYHTQILAVKLLFLRAYSTGSHACTTGNHNSHATPSPSASKLLRNRCSSTPRRRAPARIREPGVLRTSTGPRGADPVAFAHHRWDLADSPRKTAESRERGGLVIRRARRRPEKDLPCPMTGSLFPLSCSPGILDRGSSPTPGLLLIKLSCGTHTPPACSNRFLCGFDRRVGWADTRYVNN